MSQLEINFMMRRRNRRRRGGNGRGRKDQERAERRAAWLPLTPDPPYTPQAPTYNPPQQSTQQKATHHQHRQNTRHPIHPSPASSPLCHTHRNVETCQFEPASSSSHLKKQCLCSVMCPCPLTHLYLLQGSW